VIKTYTKYFSLFLSIILLNSNFSFAFPQMLCMMSPNQSECQCDTDSHEGKTIVTSKGSECCKISVSILNNSNTLEKRDFKSATGLSSFSVIYFLPVIEEFTTHSGNRIFTNCKIPVQDIPILNSSLLI
jgi:hypothetical protein